MDRAFYRNLLAITMPIAFQNIISYSVNMMDTLMLGSLGETVLSASSLAGQVFFLFSILVSGLGCGAGVLCSQYFGKRDLKNEENSSNGIKISYKLECYIYFGAFNMSFCNHEDIYP